MSERLDQYLDGSIELVALEPHERAEAQAIEHVIEETRAFVEARPAPDFSAAVFGQIAELGLQPAKLGVIGLLRAIIDPIWTSRQISFQYRPAYGLLAVAAIAGIIALSPYELRLPSMSSSAPQADTKLFVQFRFQAQNASTVRLAGTFTNWQPQYELHETAPGIWTITVPLSAGVHDYVFVVDGRRWIADPFAPHVDDGFGGINSRIALLPPDTPRS